MDMPGFPGVLRRALRAAHRHHTVCRAGATSTSLPDLLDDALHQRLLLPQGALHERRALPLPHQDWPLLLRTGREISQRADRPLARTPRGGNRFHQQIVGVGAVFVLAERLAQEHGISIAEIPPPAFESLFPPADNAITQNQELTRADPQKTAPGRLCTVEVGLAVELQESCGCFC